MQNPKILIKTKDLSVFTTDKHCLVEPISLQLYQGKNLTILGETGSGKSLLAQAIMGALPAGLIQTGEVWLNAQLLQQADCERYWGHEIAMLPQEPTRSLDPTMNIFWQTWENLFFVAKKDNQTAKNSSKTILEQLGLAKFCEYYPHELSGGMAQRASIAVATTGGANIVIADEPTKGLDEKTNKSSYSYYNKLPKTVERF